MKKLIIIILLSIVVFSCKKDTSPLLPNISLHYSGQNDSFLYEFRISNDSPIAVSYMGYSEGEPIYIVSVLADTGWVHIGGWCGTGLHEVKFYPGDSFLITVNKPQDFNTWRVGIHVYYDFDKVGETIWSQVLK